MHLFHYFYLFTILFFRFINFDNSFVFLIVMSNSFKRTWIRTKIDMILGIMTVLIKMTFVFTLVRISSRLQLFVNFKPFKSTIWRLVDQSCFFILSEGVIKRGSRVKDCANQSLFLLKWLKLRFYFKNLLNLCLFLYLFYHGFLKFNAGFGGQTITLI